MCIRDRPRPVKVVHTVFMVIKVYVLNGEIAHLVSMKRVFQVSYAGVVQNCGLYSYTLSDIEINF